MVEQNNVNPQRTYVTLASQEKAIESRIEVEAAALTSNSSTNIDKPSQNHAVNVGVVDADDVPLSQHSKQEYSIGRWLRQLFYVPFLHHGIFSKANAQKIANAVGQAEHDHYGEIKVIIESHLPLSTAYRQTVRDRALNLFSIHRVWDTQYNSGILLYVNLCEHKVEIVADRGIHNFVVQSFWDDVCANMVEKMKQKQEVDAVCSGVMTMGELLGAYYTAQFSTKDVNEIDNQPVFLH